MKSSQSSKNNSKKKPSTSNPYVLFRDLKLEEYKQLRPEDSLSELNEMILSEWEQLSPNSKQQYHHHQDMVESKSSKISHSKNNQENSMPNSMHRKASTSKSNHQKNSQVEETQDVHHHENTNVSEDHSHNQHEHNQRSEHMASAKKSFRKQSSVQRLENEKEEEKEDYQHDNKQVKQESKQKSRGRASKKSKKRDTDYSPEQEKQTDHQKEKAMSTRSRQKQNTITIRFNLSKSQPEKIERIEELLQKKYPQKEKIAVISETKDQTEVLFEKGKEVVNVWTAEDGEDLDVEIIMERIEHIE